MKRRLKCGKFVCRLEKDRQVFIMTRNAVHLYANSARKTIIFNITEYIQSQNKRNLLFSFALLLSFSLFFVHGFQWDSLKLWLTYSHWMVLRSHSCKLSTCKILCQAFRALAPRLHMIVFMNEIMKTAAYLALRVYLRVHFISVRS